MQGSTHNAKSGRHARWRALLGMGVALGAVSLFFLSQGCQAQKKGQPNANVTNANANANANENANANGNVNVNENVAVNDDLEAANPTVDFSNLTEGQDYDLTSPIPDGFTAAQTCTCAWSVDGAGTFDPADECTTTYTPAADDTLITVTRTCDSDVTTLLQDVTVTAAAGFSVDISGCPDTTGASAGVPFTLTATVMNQAGDTVEYLWTVSSGTSTLGTNGLATMEVTPGTGTSTIQVTATDLMGTNALDTDTADCTFTVAFTAELLVNAGSLNPGRASPGAYASGAPGTIGNNALNGEANQQGVDPGAIATAWTVDAQPTGSGAVSFSNSALLQTAFTVAPPALAGTYTFTLTATNESTGEEENDQVALDLLDVPTVVVTEGFIPTRLHVERGSAGRDLGITYTSDSAGFVTIYDGTANSDTLDVVAAASIVDTGGADSNGLVTIPATGDRATLAPNFFALATQITDGVGVVPGDVDADGFVTDDAVALTDPSNTDLPNEQPAILYTSVPMTEAATPAGGGVPALTELTTEVGEVAGAGTGAGLVAHSGIGAGAPALAQVSKYSIVTGVDFNEDGYDDMAVLTAAGNIDILYGRTGMNTNYAAAGAGDSWPAVAANVGEAVGGAGILVNGVAIAAGDVNGDGHADLVALENGATAGVRIILGQGPTAATPFANQATRERLYPASAAADLTGGAVLIGDVGGGPAGIDDIVIGAPNFNNGGVGDGAIFVIYGSGSLPADASILDTQAAFTPYGTSVVGVGAGADARGQVIYVGDYDGAGLLDVVAGYGNLGLNTDSIEVFPGAMPFPPAPTVTYQVGLAASLVNGSFWLADVDGTAGTDIIVGAPGALAGVGLLSIIPNGTAASTAINSASTIDYTGGVGDALGTALSVIEDGDGNTYVLVGATGGDYVDVISAPITGDFTVSGVDQRLNVAGGGTAGDSIHWNDVNADGNPDLIVGDSGAGTAYCMFGLD